MTEPAPLASLDHDAADLQRTQRFLKRTWAELRDLRRVRLWNDRFRVYDVNGDCFEIVGVGYGDDAVVALLDMVNAVYKPELLHEATDQPFKQFKTGRRYTWANDRCM